MRGLPPEEKALMQRIGNLMDAALNNRQASNPFEQSQQRLNRQVYPPTGLLTQVGISSVKILWDATPSNELLRYEVDFTNLTTGASETKTVFTNEILFKGTNGSYLARVKSVGRDGSSSTVRQIAFGLGDEAMQLEGAKNGPDELGTLVQDNIKLHDGYSVYAWGSCVLDKYMLQTNNSITFNLWMAETPDAAFSQAVLVETIVLYPGTESGTDLDASARAGQITRPAGTRAGSFETSQAVMFSPLQVDPSLDDTTVTFFLQAVNREVEQDEVCLSLVLWSGADGIGTARPGDPGRGPAAPYIHPYYNSFHKTGSPTGENQDDFPFDTRTWNARVEDGYSLVGNHWTFAMWVRFDNLNFPNIYSHPDTSVDAGEQIIFGRMKIPFEAGHPWNERQNAWLLSIHGTQDGGRLSLIMSVADRFAGEGGNPITGRNTAGIEYRTTAISGANDEVSPLFRWGDATTFSPDGSALFNDSWYFIVGCWEGGDYTNANLPKFRLYMNNGVHWLTGEPTMTLMVPSFNTSTLPITQTDEGAMSYQLERNNDNANGVYWDGVYAGDLYMGPRVTAGTQYHRIGIWNVALDSNEEGMGSTIGPIETLFNQGRGWAVDWTRNSTQHDPDSPFGNLNYVQAENLVHLHQPGAVEEWFQTKRAGRDTGHHLPDWEGAINYTYDVTDQGQDWRQTSGGIHHHQRFLPDNNWYDGLGQSWARGTDIYDILAPLGTNNTTQYDFSYPGQQMEGNGTIEQDSSNYPSFSEWVADGADLSVLPWLSAPYPPGYHKDDPDRPIKAGA
jgi:hypothetical protein